MIDLGTGNNNKSMHSERRVYTTVARLRFTDTVNFEGIAIILTSLVNWCLNNKQEMIDIVETVYRGARKGIAPLTTFGSFCYLSSRSSPLT